MNKMICISGQFDHIVAEFVSWFRHHTSSGSRIVGLSSQECKDIPGISWRLGSLVSSEDTTEMIKDADVLLHFCLTPTLEQRTEEGYETDVALTAAFNLALEAHKNPGCHAILVTRAFPDDQRNYGKIYRFWQQIIRIFQDNCPNFTLIQTEPIISEWDAITMGMVENVCLHRYANHALDPRWHNETRPVEMIQLFETIFEALGQPLPEKPQKRMVSGNTAISYHLWHKMMADHLIPHIRFDTISKLTGKFSPARRITQDLLNETLDFSTYSVHTTDEYQQFTPNLLHAQTPFIQYHLKYLSHVDVGHELILPQKAAKPGQNRTKCYVQRILSHPNRNIPDITELLMQWLPRYFQRLVHVDDMGADRRVCRLHRIPLVELEKKVESTTRCQLIVRTPWSGSLRPLTRLIVTQTGPEDAPGDLLIIIEEYPEVPFFNVGFRAILLAFGRYLKDFGVGK